MYSRGDYAWRDSIIKVLGIIGEIRIISLPPFLLDKLMRAEAYPCVTVYHQRCTTYRAYIHLHMYSSP